MMRLRPLRGFWTYAAGFVASFFVPPIVGLLVGIYVTLYNVLVRRSMWFGTLLMIFWPPVIIAIGGYSIVSALLGVGVPSFAWQIGSYFLGSMSVMIFSTAGSIRAFLSGV
jgi:hypothetical protein